MKNSVANKHLFHPEIRYNNEDLLNELTRIRQIIKYCCTDKDTLKRKQTILGTSYFVAAIYVYNKHHNISIVSAYMSDTFY